jgi:hypothetical protein
MPVSTLRVVPPSWSRFPNLLVARHKRSVTKALPTRTCSRRFRLERLEFVEFRPYMIICAQLFLPTAPIVSPPFVTGATEAADRRGRSQAGGGSSGKHDRGSRRTTGFPRLAPYLLTLTTHGLPGNALIDPPRRRSLVELVSQPARHLSFTRCYEAPTYAATCAPRSQAERLEFTEGRPYLIICARRRVVARPLIAIAAIRAGGSSRGARRLHVVLTLRVRMSRQCGQTDIQSPVYQ